MIIRSCYPAADKDNSRRNSRNVACLVKNFFDILETDILFARNFAVLFPNSRVLLIRPRGDPLALKFQPQIIRKLPLNAISHRRTINYDTLIIRINPIPIGGAPSERRRETGKKIPV